MNRYPHIQLRNLAKIIRRIRIRSLKKPRNRVRTSVFMGEKGISVCFKRRGVPSLSQFSLYSFVFWGNPQFVSFCQIDKYLKVLVVRVHFYLSYLKECSGEVQSGFPSY